MGYDTEEAAGKALAAMNEKDMDGKTISVEQLRTRQRKGVELDPCKIWVGGLDESATEEAVKGVFSGTITEYAKANNHM